MKKHYRHENDCLNCGTILTGHFCHNCGQENLEMKESFGHMVNHAVSDYFHFDDQFFHTIKPLFRQPGKLTVEYLAGRRAQYLHPVKMYIFISLVFFLAFFHGGEHNMIKVTHAKDKKKAGAAIARPDSSEVANKTKLKTAAEKKAIYDKLRLYVPDTVAKQAIADLDKKLDKAGSGKEDNNITFYSENGVKTYSDYLAKQSKLPPGKKDNLVKRYLIKKSFDWQSQGKNAVEIMQESIKHNFPKLMFVVLPLLALILYITFRKNRHFYVEHIIYAIHLHCFIFSFLLLVTILGWIIPGSWTGASNWIGTLSFLVITWYVYRSLRVVYNRSRWRTVSKMIGVSFAYSIVFGLCFFALLIITALFAV